MRHLIALLLGGTLALAITACSAASPAPAAGVAPAYSPPPRPSVIYIPALDVTSRITEDLGLQPNGEMEVPPDAENTGWFTSSPLPGRPGPSVFAAHVDWKGKPGPFKRLHELKQGDEVIVESVDGGKVTFVIDRVTTHPKDAYPTDEIYGDTAPSPESPEGRPEIRLISCGGEYDAAARSYKSNVVAWGHLKV